MSIQCLNCLQTNPKEKSSNETIDLTTACVLSICCAFVPLLHKGSGLHHAGNDKNVTMALTSKTFLMCALNF